MKPIKELITLFYKVFIVMAWIGLFVFMFLFENSSCNRLKAQEQQIAQEEPKPAPTPFDPYAYVRLKKSWMPEVKEPKTAWLGTPISWDISVNDSTIEFGLREDGVVVWRKAK